MAAKNLWLEMIKEQLKMGGDDNAMLSKNEKDG